MIEKFIGYSFKNKSLLKEALTHPSYASSKFQEFEFLGDRILALCIAEILYHENQSVKVIAHEFNNLINTNALALVAQKWKIDKYLNRNIQELSKKVLADTVEALLAAIYLDSDFFSVFKIIKHLYKTELKEGKFNIDPKMFLQEFAHKKNLTMPLYSIINSTGDDHSKIYTVQVEIEKHGCAQAKGPSKHEASKAAADKLMQMIVKIDNL